MVFDNLYNYNERLIANYIAKLPSLENKDPEYLADLCCLALNQLPARYIRHEVDMAFYMPASERLTMEMKVREAIDKSIAFLESDESLRS